MQEDKQLKELLQKHAVAHPSAGFTSGVMQRVTSAYTSAQHTTPLVKQKLPQILLGAFILVCIALAALGFFLPATAFPFQFTATLPAKYFSQIFSFFIIFWVVVLFNTAINKYSAKLS